MCLNYKEKLAKQEGVGYKAPVSRRIGGDSLQEMGMKRVLIASALVCLGTSGCVAGPGGVHNAANRTIAGAALGALLGGVAGGAVGDTSGGLVLGAVLGGGVGAAMNPNTLDPDTRGYCYTVDAQGQPIVIVADAAECKAANGQPVSRESLTASR